jgi:CheY-like chemotaxis protein
MGPRILLVEDHPDTLRIVAKLLGGYGYAVETAGDGAGALGRLALVEYNGVVLDLLLPEVNGLEVIRHVRSWEYPVPIVILTAHQHLALKAIREGAQAYLIKPFSSQALRDLTTRWFGHSARHLASQ